MLDTPSRYVRNVPCVSSRMARRPVYFKSVSATLVFSVNEIVSERLPSAERRTSVCVPAAVTTVSPQAPPPSSTALPVPARAKLHRVAVHAAVGHAEDGGQREAGLEPVLGAVAARPVKRKIWLPSAVMGSPERWKPSSVAVPRLNVMAA